MNRQSHLEQKEQNWEHQGRCHHILQDYKTKQNGTCIKIDTWTSNQNKEPSIKPIQLQPNGIQHKYQKYILEK